MRARSPMSSADRGTHQSMREPLSGVAAGLLPRCRDVGAQQAGTGVLERERVLLGRLVQLSARGSSGECFTHVSSRPRKCGATVAGVKPRTAAFTSSWVSLPSVVVYFPVFRGRDVDPPRIGPTLEVHSSSLSTEYGMVLHRSPGALEKRDMRYSLRAADLRPLAN